MGSSPAAVYVDAARHGRPDLRGDEDREGDRRGGELAAYSGGLRFRWHVRQVCIHPRLLLSIQPFSPPAVARGGGLPGLGPKMGGQRGEPDRLSQPVDPSGVGGHDF